MPIVKCPLDKCLTVQILSGVTAQTKSLECKCQVVILEVLRAQNSWVKTNTVKKSEQKHASFHAKRI